MHWTVNACSRSIGTPPFRMRRQVRGACGNFQVERLVLYIRHYHNA